MNKKQTLFIALIIPAIVVPSVLVVTNLTPQSCSILISRDTLTVTGSIDIDKNRIAHFTGVVQNNSCQTAHKVGVTVILYDAKNNVIGNLVANVNPADVDPSYTAILNGTIPMSDINGIIDHTGYDLSYAKKPN